MTVNLNSLPRYNDNTLTSPCLLRSEVYCMVPDKGGPRGPLTIIQERREPAE